MLAISAEPIPLTTDADGVVRIGTTRVTLDTVVAAYREGMTPEGIVEQYPSLRLANVYSVLGYVLSHPEEVNTYLAGRQQQSTDVRQENEARHAPTGVRERLLARRSQG